MEPVARECARKLVQEAAQYAANLGFSPHPNFRLACRVFGGIRAEDCSKEFTFGREGKPFYVSGPNDTEAMSRRIVEQLARRCGAGNFDYIVAAPQNYGVGMEGMRLPASPGCRPIRRHTPLPALGVIRGELASGT